MRKQLAVWDQDGSALMDIIDKNESGGEPSADFTKITSFFA
jgi:hypothetical protein